MSAAKRTWIGLIVFPVAVILTVSRQHVRGKRMPHVLSVLKTDRKVAALTFDDGPDSRFTPEILDELKKLDVRATFFLIGEQVSLHPDIARRIVAEGHVIGNHTYTHPHLDRMPGRIIDAELQSCDEIIEKTTGHHPAVFRAPRGDLNPTVTRKANERGYTIVQWTVSADHHDAPTPEAMAERVLQRARPGMIVLIHDGRTRDRAKDVKALPLIIKGLREKGFAFVPLEGKWIR